MSDAIMPQTPAANDRFNRGIALLQLIGGRNYDQPLQQLADIAPELARYMVEFCYGDVLAGSTISVSIFFRKSCNSSTSWRPRNSKA